MKILFCTNSFEHITNGPAKFANLLLQMPEQETDTEIRILTEDITVPVKGVYKMDVRYHPVFRYLGQLIRIFLYARNIRRIRKAYDYDVLVFNHSFHGLLISYFEKKPIVGMVNDDNASTKNFKNFSFSKDWLSYYIYGRLEKWSVKRFPLTLVNSIFLKNRLVQDYRLVAKEQEKLVVFYKAIELETAPLAMQPMHDPVRVLFVKADFERGGLGVLGKALAQLNNYRFILTVIGPEERFRSKVLALAGDAPHVQVNYLGYQNAAFVKTAMLENDIFCVPSYQEALGVANLEALSRGISVVSSNAGGIPEILDHGNNGWMAEAGNAHALAAALESCIKNETLRSQKRQSGLKYIEQFNVVYMYKRFKAVLNGIV